MRFGIQPMLPIITAAVLAISSAAAAQTAQQDTPDKTAPPMQGMSGMSGMQGAPGTGGTQPMMGQMMEQMKANDARLKDLLARMNAATGTDKVDAMAAAINEMATQQMAMHQRMGMMMGNRQGMQSMQGMPGMQSMQSMQSMQGAAGGAASGGLIVTGVTSPYPPKVGKNTFTFTVKNAKGQPLAGAHPRVSVSMAGMNMGTAHPAVGDLGGGRYRTKADLTMAGRWQITVTTTPPGGAPVAKAFFFNVAGK